MRKPQVLVEIRGSSNVPVCFVDGVEEVRAHDYDVDAPSMLDKSWGTGLRFWIARADSDTVVCALEPSCHQLVVLSVCFFEVCLVDAEVTPYIWEECPASEREEVV